MGCRVFASLILLMIVGAQSARSEGSAVGWGFQVVVGPEDLQGVTAVSAGGLHSVGLKTDGSLVAWGYNEEGQCDVPDPNTGFLAVAAGFGHSLGLRNDGSIAAWGSNVHGECNVPPPNVGFVAIAAGGGRDLQDPSALAGHSLGLKTDGSIVAWGSNTVGECDVPAPNAGFVAIASGAHHSLGLRGDGSIVAWGDNAHGQCDVPAPNTGFVAVAGGYSHSLGLKSDGSIVAWGNNWEGECDVPAPNSGFVAVAGGAFCTVGLRGEQPTALECSGLQAVPRGRAVELTWFSSARRDFEVHRAGEADAVFTRLGEVPVSGSGALSYVDASVNPSTSYRYRLRFIDATGREILSDPVRVTTGAWDARRIHFTSVGPSPARGDVVVRFSLMQESWARVSVYDAAGRLVRVLGEGQRQRGDHTLTWSGHDTHGNRVASGVYLVRLTDGKATESRKVVLRR